ncbi:MAG: LPS-assembly protein LptD [Alphaproteobacteria bacterium]|nr:LPS-assembly protein LptD [Alphaproteobacteria bacterium]
MLRGGGVSFVRTVLLVSTVAVYIGLAVSNTAQATVLQHTTSQVGIREPQYPGEVVLTSRSISYDPASGIMAATGDVIVKQMLEGGGIRELHAEKIEHSKLTGKTKLVGESVIKEPTGEIMSAKNVEIGREFEEAIADALFIVLKDSAKIHAEKGSKAGQAFTFENATYSPCKETSCSAPLWDLAADKAVYDKEQKKFVYKNVTLRIKGVPIFFTPYFEHPSSDVKRKAGLLSPTFRNLSDVGFFAGFPIYVPIGDDKDLTFTPFFNSKKRAFASGSYRQLFSHADLDVSASFLSKMKRSSKSKKTNSKATNRDKRNRWHIDTRVTSHNLDNKRLRFRINRSSDMTYKSIYPVSATQDGSFHLTRKCNDSNAIIDFYDRNYFLTTETHVYQTEDRDTVPFVFPHISFNSFKNISDVGEFSIDSDTVYLTRHNAKSTMFAECFFRTSNAVAWNKSFDVSPVLLELNSGVRADVLSIEKDERSGVESKMFPILENQLSASVPFVSQISPLEQTSIWAPKITLTSVETSKRRANFEQNEDSIFDNFSDLSLYSINRFGGYDAVETGERLSLGFENSMYNSKRRWLNFFIGKSNNIGSRQKGKFQGRNSMVGRLVLKPVENLSFRVRFIGMPFVEKSQLFESGINGSYGRFSGGVSYMYDKKISHVQENGISQVGFTGGFKLTETWKISASEVINGKQRNGKRSLTQGVHLTYADECLELRTGVSKTNFRDGDIKPRTVFTLVIVFKNLGNLFKSDKAELFDANIGTVE